MSSKRDYYEVLSVSRDASDQELKQAYRRLAIQYHPDKNSGDVEAEEKFKEVAEAYQVLSTPELRSRYDRYGHSGIGSGGGSPFGGGFGQGFPGFEDILGDLFGFGDIFGSRSGRRGPRRGSDLRYDIEITLEEAAKGLTTKIRVPRLETCDTCGGTGATPGSSPTRCQTCSGTGQVRYQQGFFSLSRTCSHCRGTGRIIRDRCKACQGEGRVERDRMLEVRVPPGVDTGSRLRINGEGESGEPGASRGDLYVVVNVKEHAFFERRDSDLYCEIPISFSQAALGADIEIPTLDEPVNVHIDEATQTGTTYKIKNKGMPSISGRGRGDLYARVTVVTPSKLTREQRQLLEELASLETGNKREDRGIVDKVRDMFGSG